MFACARTSRREARAVSCESQIYFSTLQNFRTPPKSLPFVPYDVRATQASVHQGTQLVAQLLGARVRAELACMGRSQSLRTLYKRFPRSACVC